MVSENEVNVLQDRSQKIFTATLALLPLLFGGGLLGIITAPKVDDRVILLWIVAAIMNVVAAMAGLAAVNWQSMTARARTLYHIQIAALILVFVSLLGVAGTLVFPGLGSEEQASPTKNTGGNTENVQGRGDAKGTDSGQTQGGCDAQEVEPAGATASDESPPHEDNSGNYFTYEPENAIDGADDTTWRVPGDGKDQWIQLDYTQPVKVCAVGIIPGHDKIDPADGMDRFYQLYVVRRAEIIFSDGTAVEADYERNRSMQFVYLDSPKKTKSVLIVIQDTYRPGDNPNGQQYPFLVYETAISEVEVK